MMIRNKIGNVYQPHSRQSSPYTSHNVTNRRYQMSEVKNPRVHAEILPALAAVVAPTNKILAIGSVTAKGTPEAIAPVLPFEVRATVRNYLAGKIDQWFFQADGYGVVFIMNAS